MRCYRRDPRIGIRESPELRFAVVPLSEYNTYQKNQSESTAGFTVSVQLSKNSLMINSLTCMIFDLSLSSVSLSLSRLESAAMSTGFVVIIAMPDEKQVAPYDF